MIRILHLTDFHLNNKTLKDWNDFMKVPFLNKIEEIDNTQKIDLIVFTGDLIDQAGKDFGSVTNGLECFSENVIFPILEKLELDISRFIICPGNHDINRNADKSFVHNGLTSDLKSIDAINTFTNTSEDDYDGIQRIKEYKDFELELYKATEDKIHSKFKFSIKLNINGKSVGISSLNSSWRCYGDNDRKNILLGENQINDNYQFIKECDLKIALMHHQLDWLSDVESKIVKSHISSNYDLIFSGHVHETDAELVQNLTGTSLRIVSPSGLNQIREKDSNYINGFSLLDYGSDNKCHFFKYNHTQKIFVDNTEVCDKGVFKIDIKSNALASEKKESIILEEEFRDFLNDSGANFTHRSKTLLLDDIYVSPFLEQFSLIEQEEKSTSVSLDSIFEKISKEEITHSVFLGEENSGKTSLCKRLYRKLLLIENVLPIYIKGRDIKNVADNDIERLIHRECRKQYKNDCNSQKYRKIIIIDDFNNCTLPQKSKRSFINYLYNSDYKTVITWDEFFTLSDLLESQTMTVEIYEILKFGVKKRLELIRKWIDLIEDEYNDEAEKEFQINQLFKIINAVIGKNLVPSLPIYILTILQANELTNSTNFEQSTFGHYYDVLVKSAIGQNIKDNKEIEKYYSYMTELSYYLFKNKVIETNESNLIEFHQNFKNQYKLQISFRETIETLEKCNLLDKINDSYKFKYKYIYFYFIGKYLSDNIEEEFAQNIIIDLSDKLYQTDSANIYIFLSHHSKSKFVVTQILERAKKLFENEPLIGFNEDIKHINTLIDGVTEKIDFDDTKSIDEHMENEHINLDNNIDESLDKELEFNEVDSISLINKSFKTIEILGYILKNRYASLKGLDKEELVEELYKLGLRSLSFLFKVLLEGEEYIKREIIDIIRNDPNSTLTQNEKEELAKHFMFNLLYMVSYSIFKRISNSTSSRDLELTFKDVKSKLLNEKSGNKNNTVSLIDMAVVFEYSRSFPEAIVKDLAKEFKYNPLAFSILRRLGVNYMRMMPMNESEQQKASNLLNISMKRQRVISATSVIKK